MSGPDDPERTLPWTGQQPIPASQRAQRPRGGGRPLRLSSISRTCSRPSHTSTYPRCSTRLVTRSARPPPATVPRPNHGQPTQFPQQSAHHALFTAPAEKRSKRNLALIAGVAGALAAVIIVVLVLCFWAPGFLKATNLDVDAAQSGVKQILMDDANGYGVKDVTDVKATTGGTRKCRKARRSTARSAWTAPNAK
jgi:hypothetical protein